MFSRLARRSFEIQKPLIIKYQPASAVKTSSSEKSFPPTDSSQRDLVNFPRLVRAEYPPPVRHLMIPESWFQSMYPKTGVTGPYMLFFGLSTFLLSKEIVVEHGLPHVASTCILITFIYYKFGDIIAKYHNDYQKDMENQINAPQIQEQENVANEIESLKASIYDESLIDEVIKAKKENILLQMEATYRERLTEVYKKAKKQLDFQMEMENAERRVFQKNLADYVIRNVLSSITPEQEKNTMQLCINNLNSLASKA